MLLMSHKIVTFATNCYEDYVWGVTFEAILPLQCREMNIGLLLKGKKN